MKKHILFIILILNNINLIFGQISDDSYYVYLFSDSVIYGKNIKYVTPVFKKAYFMVDSAIIYSGFVKFYKDESGFYANIKLLNFWKTDYFAKRVEKGNINLYRKTTIDYVPGTYNYTTGTYTPGITKYHIKEAYNRGFGDIKKASYKNLIVDLSDNPQSILYLKKYRRTKTAGILLKITGAAAFMGGIISAIAKDNIESRTANYIVAGVGVICLIGTGPIHNLQRKHFLNAIDVYNE